MAEGGGSQGILSGLGRKLGEKHTIIEVKKHDSIESKKHNSIEVENHASMDEPKKEKFEVKRSYYLRPTVAKKLSEHYIKRYSENSSVTYNQIIEEAILLLCNQQLK